MQLLSIPKSIRGAIISWCMSQFFLGGLLAVCNTSPSCKTSIPLQINLCMVGIHVEVYIIPLADQVVPIQSINLSGIDDKSN